MAIETTIYTPRTLGKLITRMPPVHTFFRDTLFKNRRTFPTKSVDVDFKKGSRRKGGSEQRLPDEDLHPCSAGP